MEHNIICGSETLPMEQAEKIEDIKKMYITPDGK